jgi:hypothetical protein
VKEKSKFGNIWNSTGQKRALLITTWKLLYLFGFDDVFFAVTFENPSKFKYFKIEFWQGFTNPCKDDEDFVFDKYWNCVDQKTTFFTLKSQPKHQIQRAYA